MEFKRLSDVEVVAEPSESANVLIEENGVIKKAPKTAVGGAGGGGGLCITFNSRDWVFLHVPDDLYNTIKEMYSTGIFIPVDAIFFSEGYANRRLMNSMTDEGDYFRIDIDGGYGLEVYSNGDVLMQDYG